MRVGITVSSKVGGAVVRNRMKRRFRELARAVLPLAGIGGADHILIGRKEGIEREFGLLRAELEKALRRVTSKILAEPDARRGNAREAEGAPHRAGEDSK
jgi:ribonuclease P protein component